MRLERIVVAGSGLAGLRAAETLRRCGFDGSLVMIGAEAGMPYDRPPLSKEILKGTKALSDTLLCEQGHFDELKIELQLGTRCLDIDANAKRIQTEVGWIDFDGCVIATGAAPRRLRSMGQLEGVYVLRTADDARLIASVIDQGPRAVVVGAGFIGAEVAASLKTRGLDVTVVEALPAPLAGILGPELAQICTGLHHDHGTKLLCGVGVERIEGSGRVERVVLTDGSMLEADLVIVGIGAAPNVDWLMQSTLDVSDGVVCDATLHAGHPAIVACGDVAQWPNYLFRKSMRCEHWTNAVEQAIVAARNLLAGPDASATFRSAAYFWSEQYGMRLQSIGYIAGLPGELVAGSVDERRFIMCFRDSDRLAGAFAMNSPRLVMKAKALFEREAPWDEAIAALRT